MNHAAKKQLFIAALATGAKRWKEERKRKERKGILTLSRHHLGAWGC